MVLWNQGDDKTIICNSWYAYGFPMTCIYCKKVCLHKWTTHYITNNNIWRIAGVSKVPSWWKGFKNFKKLNMVSYCLCLNNLASTFYNWANVMGFRENSMLTTYETKLASTKVDVDNKSTNMRRTWHRLALTKSLTFTTIDSQMRRNMTWIFNKNIHAHNNILANARRTQHALSIKKLTIDRQNLFELHI
jgi:hypothetical protein